MRLIVALAMLAVALVAAPVPGASRGEPQTTARPGDAGQRIVTGMAGLRPSARLLRRVREGEVGGVILFGWNVTSGAQTRSAIASLQRAASRGGQPPLLVMTDQEGGAVKRFRWLPPAYPARRMGRDPELAGREGRRTGRALRRLGVNVDLAPVGDVPHSARHFLGSRAFGRRADRVAAAAGAFARGLRGARVAGTAKHFPGLGYANAHTDFNRVRVRTRREALRADYEPFKAMIQDGTPLVMLSNAAYDALDPRGRPACMSRPIIEGELRGVAGFTGVTISDALGSPAIPRGPNAYVDVANAGVDLLLFGTEQASEAAYRALVASARRGGLDAARNVAAVRRIRALKEALGR